MCGIAGFAGLQNEPLLREMVESLRHRGPDGSGFLHQDGVGLGSRRLAVLDLEGGRQPIAGERGPVVVFNGEIYNFKALRAELEAAGHPFRTRSDTEVIVHLYEQEGVEGLERLSGMFAFALWDPRERLLLLARDHLGVKPLYYAAAGDTLYFASELKALRLVPGLCGEPDLAALAHYLDHLYIPAPRTVYPGVSKLRPGERLAWRDGRIEIVRYWVPRLRPRRLSRLEALEELGPLLRTVVSEQTVADVPAGLFLSGGIDSSAVAWCLSQGGAPPEAYCAFFPEGGQDFNELDKARSVARALGLKLHELPVAADCEEALEALTTALDEPLADSSALPTYWVSRAARGHVKVALTGMGGDEVFGGYPRYVGARLMEAYGRLPAAVRRAFAGAARAVPEAVSSRDVGGWARRFLASGHLPAPEAYSRWMGHLGEQDKAALYAPALFGACGPSAVLDAFSGAEGDLLQRILAVDLRTYLPEDLLTLADRASMAVGLELRVPLCDQRLVEFALSLPSELRVRGATLKPLLKDLLEGRLPPEVLRQKKQGFMVPVGRWFRGRLRPVVEDRLETLGGRGLLAPRGVRVLWNEHLRGRRNRTDVLWAMVLLESWFRRYHPAFGLNSAAGFAGRAGERRPLRILAVSDFIFPDHAGGSGRVAWETARALVARGHAVTAWCMGPGRPEETIDGLAVRRLTYPAPRARPWGWPAFLAAARRSLDSAVQAARPERLLTHGPLTAWLAGRRPALAVLPSVHCYFSSWPEEYRVDRKGGLRAAPGAWLRDLVEREVVHRAGRLAAISRSTLDEAVIRFGLAPERVQVVPLGADFARFTPGDRAAARRRLGLDGEPLLLTVRNLRERMGLDLLLEAAALLRRARPGLRVVIGGRGPLERELKGLAADLGLGGVARFAGRIPDEALPDYYRAADAFVLPSRSLEGFGLVLLEALGCGTPCAGTPVGAIPEVLEPVVGCRVAREVSARALASAVEGVLSAPADPAALRGHVLARYGWDKTAAALEELLQEPRG